MLRPTYNYDFNGLFLVSAIHCGLVWNNGELVAK